jgi:hypothetical protein
MNSLRDLRRDVPIPPGSSPIPRETPPPIPGVKFPFEPEPALTKTESSTSKDVGSRPPASSFFLAGVLLLSLFLVSCSPAPTSRWERLQPVSASQALKPKPSPSDRHWGESGSEGLARNGPAAGLATGARGRREGANGTFVPPLATPARHAYTTCSGAWRQILSQQDSNRPQKIDLAKVSRRGLRPRPGTYYARSWPKMARIGS